MLILSWYTNSPSVILKKKEFIYQFIHQFIYQFIYQFIFSSSKYLLYAKYKSGVLCGERWEFVYKLSIMLNICGEGRVRSVVVTSGWKLRLLAVIGTLHAYTGQIRFWWQLYLDTTKVSVHCACPTIWNGTRISVVHDPFCILVLERIS